MHSARELATQVVRALRGAGHGAYFAGGCVRDELLGLTPADYDVATAATPDDVRALGRTHNWSVNEVGVSFGVLLVTPRAQPAADRHTIEVATFREEGAYTDKRRPDAVRFSTASADAQRRDYTVNALFLDPLESEPNEPAAAISPAPLGGWVVDFVGGVADLRAKLLRAVGDPNARLAEDHLRALRAVRLACRLGFTIDPATREAIARDAASLTGVSRERIGDELRRMLSHPSRAEAMATLQALGLDAPVLMEAHTEPPLPTLRALDSGASAMTALCAWILDRAPGPPRVEARAAAARLRAALCLSNEETDAVRETLIGLDALQGQWPAWGVAGRKRFAAGASCQPALHLVAARQPALAARARQEIDALAATPGGLAPAPLVTGDDLVAAGLRPGPAFRALLDRVYDLQLEGALATREQALAAARELAN